MFDIWQLHIGVRFHYGSNRVFGRECSRNTNKSNINALDNFPWDASYEMRLHDVETIYTSIKMTA
jgi:hypothetical protein